MKKGDLVLMTYNEMENITYLATYYEKQNNIYLFKDLNGFFGVSEKKVTNGSVTLEVVDD